MKRIFHTYKRFLNSPIEEASALASLGNNSEFRTQGNGPKPMEKLATKIMVAAIGSHVMLSNVSPEDSMEHKYLSIKKNIHQVRNHLSH